MIPTPRPFPAGSRRPGLFAAVAAGLLLVAGAACSDSVGPGEETDGSQDQLVFVSDRSGVLSETGDPLTDIYRVMADGSGMENLTNAPAPVYRDLRLSSDQTKIAFESDRVGCYNVWVMGVDGTNPLQLTGQPGERCNEMPRWSRDGSRLAFTTSREPIERSWEAYVMNADGTNPHNVSDDSGLGDGGADWPHGWSSDGRLVFHHQKTGPPRTFIAHIDGSGRAPFLELEAGYAPFWSPDGSQIAFVSEQDGSPDVYVMNSDGSGIRNLTQDPGEDTFFHGDRANLYINPWSPNGTMMAFMSQRDGNGEVYVMGPDGSGLSNLTNDPGTDRFDGWSADGTRIAFESDRTGSWHIYVVNVDGTGLRQLTDGSSNDWNAIWVAAAG